MLTFVIFVIGGVVIGVVKEWKWIKSIGDFIAESLLGAIIGGVIGVILMFALPMRTEVKTYQYEIEVLQDSDSVSGNFLLGSGHINGSFKYVFYYKTDGGFKMGQVDYRDAIIKYSDDIKVIRYREEMTDSFINWFAVDFWFSDRYEIFVPEGTIKQNYSLDAL